MTYTWQTWQSYVYSWTINYFQIVGIEFYHMFYCGGISKFLNLSCDCHLKNDKVQHWSVNPCTNYLANPTKLLPMTISIISKLHIAMGTIRFGFKAKKPNRTVYIKQKPNQTFYALSSI